MTSPEAKMAELTALMHYAGNGELGIYQMYRSDPMVIATMKEAVKRASQEDLDLMVPHLTEPVKEAIEYCKLLVKIDWLEAELERCKGRAA